MNMPIRTLILSIFLGLGGMAASFQASADRAVRFERGNPMGGNTAGVMRHQTGPNGGSFSQRRVVRTDDAGNARVVSGGAFQTPNGASGARAGTTLYGSDGSVQHQSGMTANGTRGSVTSSGGYSLDANGNATQSRNTTATNAATGNSYQGSTSYSSETGFSHSGTCIDAAGNDIPCPSR